MNTSKQRSAFIGLIRVFLRQVEAVKNIDFGQVAAGEDFSLALSLDRLKLYSFGRSDYGQLGVAFVEVPEPFSFKPLPQRVQFPDPTKHISAIEAGDRNGFALMEDDELYSWGFNEELATGIIPENGCDRTDIFIPHKVDLSNIKLDNNRNADESYVCHPVYVSCGGNHALILARPNQ
jgi:alpha-tubulin suppressor-like RCC1 family protein